ncbi:Uncharacterised protein [Mycobacteroides abscessus subsp. abscessus]|nr:Uncharacterised protein [Mycobacteroides abscessus subsp. abscessus]
MTDALSDLSRCGTAARRSACPLRTLKENASARSSLVVSKKGFGMVPPTLLTTTSSRPNRSTAFCASAAEASVSDRSATTTSAWRPAACTFAATSRSWDSVREAISTSAPA